ncbi:MAG: hypothetical protein CM15mP100_5880 [Alphaproteobacteria bacterium]|nr:MAG: hypothetical protein CM15mP100_5880 [Alphaproteobacteria bacterium]
MENEAVHSCPPKKKPFCWGTLIRPPRIRGVKRYIPGMVFFEKGRVFFGGFKGPPPPFFGPKRQPGKKGQNLIGFGKTAGVSRFRDRRGGSGDIEKKGMGGGQKWSPDGKRKTAGGGEKGMQGFRKALILGDGMRAAKKTPSFWDDRFFRKIFWEKPRHIEIQVLADTHGNGFI